MQQSAEKVIHITIHPRVPTPDPPVPTVPLAPTDFAADVAFDSAILTWTNNATDATYLLLERSDDGGLTYATAYTLPAATVSYIDSLTSNVLYKYRLTAGNSTGVSVPVLLTITTPPPPVVPPSAPTAFTATATSSSAVALAWTPGSANETGFEIGRGTVLGTYTLIETTLPGVTTYADTGRTASTTYFYEVRAVNSAGNSIYALASATTQAAPILAPLAPTNGTATGTSAHDISLSWTDNATNETGYEIERGTVFGTYATLVTVLAGWTSWDDTGLVAETTYYYRVRAINTGGNSAWLTMSATTQAEAVTVPVGPSAFAAVGSNDSTVLLSWVDNSTNETGFEIERGTVLGTYSPLTTTAAGVVAYADTGRTASTTYFYQVRAVNSAGGSAWALASATTQAPPVTLPAAPSSLTDTAASTTRIDQAWTNNATNATSIEVERKLTSGSTWGVVATLAPVAVTNQDQGLAAATAYQHRVRARNSAGYSAYSNTAGATTNSGGGIPVGGKVPLVQSDFTWLGNYQQPAGFSWYLGWRMAHRWVGGQRRLLICSAGQIIDECSIVSEPGTGALSTCPRLVPIKVHNNWKNGQCWTGQNTTGSEYVWGIHWNELRRRLYFNYGNGYNGGNQLEPCFGYAEEDVSGFLKGVACWGLNGRSEKVGRGNCVDIPQWFADLYTGGKTLGVGIGGAYTVGATSSLGLALAAIDHPSTSVIPSRGMIPGWIEMGQCPMAADANPVPRAPREGNYRQWYDGGAQWLPPPYPLQPAAPARFQPDPVTGQGVMTWDCYINGAGCWIDTPTKSGMLVFPTLGNGDSYYYNSNLNVGGESHWFYSYDPAQLAEVIAGTRAKHACTPTYWKVNYPGVPYQPDGYLPAQRPVDTKYWPAGACYDPVERRLYVCIKQGDGDKYPIISVWQVN